jgi:hypothetical protein
VKGDSFGAKTMALDPKRHRLFVDTSDSDSQALDASRDKKTPVACAAGVSSFM